MTRITGHHPGVGIRARSRGMVSIMAATPARALNFNVASCYPFVLSRDFAIEYRHTCRAFLLTVPPKGSRPDFTAPVQDQIMVYSP